MVPDRAAVWFMHITGVISRPALARYVCTMAPKRPGDIMLLCSTTTYASRLERRDIDHIFELNNLRY